MKNEDECYIHFNITYITSQSTTLCPSSQTLRLMKLISKLQYQVPNIISSYSFTILQYLLFICICVHLISCSLSCRRFRCSVAFFSNHICLLLMQFLTKFCIMLRKLCVLQQTSFGMVCIALKHDMYDYLENGVSFLATRTIQLGRSRADICT